MENKVFKDIECIFLNVYANPGIESIATQIVVIGFTRNRK